MVGKATNVEALDEVVAQVCPGVISLDVQMPGMPDPAVVAALTALDVPVLLFTLQPVDDTIAALVSAGAMGYLHKSSSLREYLDALAALRDGRRIIPPELDRLAGTAPKHPAELLTPREYEIFLRLAAGDTIKEAAFHVGLSTSTVYTHAERVRRKTGVSTSAEIVRYAARWNLD